MVTGETLESWIFLPYQPYIVFYTMNYPLSEATTASNIFSKVNQCS